MKCPKVRTLLVALLDDELAPSQREQVLDHVEQCDTCALHHAELAATTPLAPVISLESAQRHELHLAIEHALDHADAHPPRAVRMSWRGQLARDIPVPSGVVVLYAAALLLAIGFAARGSLLSADAPTVVDAGEQAEEPHTQVNLHRPAAYTPQDGWF